MKLWCLLKQCGQTNSDLQTLDVKIRNFFLEFVITLAYLKFCWDILCLTLFLIADGKKRLIYRYPSLIVPRFHYCTEARVSQYNCINVIDVLR